MQKYGEWASVWLFPIWVKHGIYVVRDRTSTMSFSYDIRTVNIKKLYENLYSASSGYLGVPKVFIDISYFHRAHNK